MLINVVAEPVAQERDDESNRLWAKRLWRMRQISLLDALRRIGGGLPGRIRYRSSDIRESGREYGLPGIRSSSRVAHLRPHRLSARRYPSRLGCNEAVAEHGAEGQNRLRD